MGSVPVHLSRQLGCPPSFEAIKSAAERIAGAVAVTPVVRSDALDKITSRQLVLKLESLQKTGSFKVRGATNAVLCLAHSARAVVTHSSGNHAAALAHAAREAGLAAHVVMPGDARREKIERVRALGATLTFCEPTAEARLAAALRRCEETGGVLVPPSDDPDVMAGQGTVALELLAEVPGLAAIVVPVGGGGLLAGVALAARGLGSRARIIGVEPEGADDAARSKAAGQHLPPRGPAETIADGLRAPLVAGAWPVVRDLVDDVIAVSDADIVAAMRLLRTTLGLIVEPSAAAALAGALTLPPLRGPVGVVLTGGNIDPSSPELEG